MTNESSIMYYLLLQKSVVRPPATVARRKMSESHRQWYDRTAIGLMIFLCGLTAISACRREPEIRLTDQQSAWLGHQIYRNECGADPRYLVAWNEGEEFPSLGIGHFIWYPRGYRGPFQEVFPRFIRHIQSQGKSIPDWLTPLIDLGAPWRSREELISRQESEQVRLLHQWLAETLIEQTRFMVQRAAGAVPRLLESTEKKRHVEHHIQELIKTQAGLYALIDYTNFKGEGLSPKERYKGQGWGLLQVLEAIPENTPADELVIAFADAADELLRRRVANSPPGRNEQRWLAGWKKRVDTYRQAARGEL